MKKLFILSTKAGRGDFNEFKDKVVKTYKDHQRLDELEVVMTQHKDHARLATRDFITQNPLGGIVIACGGDGTLGEVADEVAGSKVALGLIPMGTANDFAKNFDYGSFKIEDTFEPVIRPIDTIEVNGKSCINVLSLGFDTKILKRAYDILEVDPSQGKKAFYKAVVKSLSRLEAEELTLTLNLAGDELVTLKDTFIVSAVCNGSYYGAGFNPAPKARLDDGVLSLIIAKNQSLLRLLPLILRYKFGAHLGDRTVKEYLVKSGTISSNKDLLANIDGEIFQAQEINFRVLEGGLNWAYFNKGDK